MGQIEYFNKTLAKYRATYSDDSEDYIFIDDIDGVEIILFDKNRILTCSVCSR